MSRALPFLAAIALSAFAARIHAQTKAPPAGKVDFARDVLPILSANCFTCHGPDEKPRKAGLRLDLGETATKKLRSGARAVVPGDPKNSELIARIFTNDPDERMPPAKSQKTLKDAEKELLRRWIAEGAEYQKHWAFVAPRRPALPAVKNAAWAKSPIDRFVLARLEKEGLAPLPEADRYTLARRVTLDLTGLPPTIEAVDRFVKDPSPDAYEKFVDLALKSPAYGERWAHVWLDLARYADSNGYATDNLRTIWRYRDWVIDAINADMPFDQFTIEQLAGDLLPNATQQQILATAFHRNTLTNDEGGTSDEEFRVAAVVDRVNTTLQVWMGISMACAQCHDHKYDPISQEEYFRTFAIFNQTEDADKSDNTPVLSSLTPAQQKQKTKLEADIAGLEKELLKPSPDLDAKQKQWEKETKADKLPANVKTILALDAAKRTPAQQAELTKYYRSITAELKQTQDQLGALKKQLAAIPVVTTPIMKELQAAQKRVTKIHIRGNFLDQGKEVQPGIPAVFPSLPKELAPNRLAVARWLVDPQNPLTARVAVNRYWEQLFGVGLLDTPDDFGIRGKLPNHPELLDWLAVEFQAEKWDVKKLLRLIVKSATYRQSSGVTPALLERDPDNKLFARGPRFRVPAEVVRDQALFVSGLLSSKMHGAPVRPPRPKLGLTAAFGGGTDWDPSPGEDQHRRALYTQWRRTSPYPSMITFDAPSRNVCAVTRPRTNTPLQALVTLNDPVFVEAAQALARRMVMEGGATVESRATYGFRLCLARPPQAKEVERLTTLFTKARAGFASNIAEASKLATEPLGPLPAGQDAAEMAAWTVVANVLLNLDEMVSKR
jgi:mono/diheme cytochrome c family protein